MLASDIKLIRSLQQKKFRREHGLFVVEGVKMVDELKRSDYEIVKIFASEDYAEAEKVSPKELERISSLRSPNKVLALAKTRSFEPDVTKNSVLLDGVNDPGNLGTIIRLADWYGVEQIVCSEDCVDVYNSKVVQSTMGSLFRVKVVYADLQKFVSDTKIPVYAAVMDGDEEWSSGSNYHLLMGSESHGLRGGLDREADTRITIQKRGEAESLNVGVATGILLDRFSRS